MARLGVAELLAQRGLRQVRAGRISRYGAGFYDGGERVGVLLGDALDALLADGLLVLGEADAYGWCRVGASEAGQARYRELCRRQRRSELAVPPEQHPVAESPAGHQGAAPPAGDRPDPAEKGAEGGTAGR